MMNFVIVIVVSTFCIVSSILLPPNALQNINHAKIIEGEPASIGRFPHVAELFIYCHAVDDPKSYVLSFYCGSSIVNQRLLITAAHCVHSICYKNKIRIRVGNSYRDQGKEYKIKRFERHPAFNPKKPVADIALLLTSTAIAFGDRAKRLVLMKSLTFPKYAVIAGWGDTEFGKLEGSRKLQYMDTKLSSQKECEAMLGGALPNNTFCGGNENSRSYIAHGDSGNGLVAYRHYLIGVASFIPQHMHTVTVYTDVCQYYSWIEETSVKLLCDDD